MFFLFSLLYTNLFRRQHCLGGGGSDVILSTGTECRAQLWNLDCAGPGEPAKWVRSWKRCLQHCTWCLTLNIDKKPLFRPENDWNHGERQIRSATCNKPFFFIMHFTEHNMLRAVFFYGNASMKILLMIFFTWQNIIVYPCEGKKVRIKCNEDDTIGDLKKLVAAQCGTRSASSCSLSLWLSSCHSLISISLLSTLFLSVLSRCFSHIYLSCILSLSLILSFSLCISLSLSLRLSVFVYMTYLSRILCF